MSTIHSDDEFEYWIFESVNITSPELISISGDPEVTFLMLICCILMLDDNKDRKYSVESVSVRFENVTLL